VVHHALIAVIGPIFERGFIAHTFANRIGKGTHSAIATYEGYRDRYAYVLRADIYRYFPAIDHEILKAEFRRRIACERTLQLVDAIIDGSNPQELVNLHFAGDDLFTPFARRRLSDVCSLSLLGQTLSIGAWLRAPRLMMADSVIAKFFVIGSRWRRRRRGWPLRASMAVDFADQAARNSAGY
jgi:hypothetical protein